MIRPALRWRVRDAATRLALSIAFAAACAPARAETPPVVRVTSNLFEGQGLLMTRLGRCIAVLPAHVLGGQAVASLTGAEDRDALGDGRLIGLDARLDIALLEVSGALTRHCGHDFVAPVDPSQLHASGTAVLKFVPPGGSNGGLPLVVLDVGPDTLEVRSAPGAGVPELAEGYSGSLVVVDEQPAAMLLSVNRDNGNGRALRYERILPVVRALIDVAPAGRGLTATGRGVAPAGPNLAAAAAGARVLRWSVTPLRPEASATHLVEGDPELLWTVAPPKGVADVDVELAGGGVKALTHVACSLARIEPGHQPVAIDVLVSVDGETWSLAGSLLPNADGTSAEADFAPRRARFLRLRVRSRTDGAEVSIGTLFVR